MNSMTGLRKKSKLESQAGDRSDLPESQIDFKAIIKKLWYWHRNRKRDQWCNGEPT